MNQRLLTILETLSKCPVISTDHAARYFTNSSPGKRASEALTELSTLKLIEGKRRAIGESKVWRLSKKGREQYGVTRQPVALNSPKVNHYLAIATLYQDIQEIGKVYHWTVELREPFQIGSKKLTYCPDAYCWLKTPKGTHAYFIEVQQSPITSNRWGEKWAMATSFMESDAFPVASFQTVEGRVIRPRILVISKQQPETIQGGSRLPLIITPDIKKAPL